jgi:copper chaperone
MPQYHVPDMTCGHCAQKIDKAVKSVDANATLTVDLPAHRVSVQSGETSSKFLEAIQAAGFTPRAV